jgi:DnaJ-class molecular chaperone
MDFYEVLGVNENASDTDIKQAYRALSFKYHPDRNSSAEAGERMRDINEAYETLIDKSKRKQYDMRGSHPLENILNEIFKGQSMGQKKDPFEMMFNQAMGQSMGMGQGMGMGQAMGFEPVFARVSTHHFEAQKPPVLEKRVEISFEESYTGGQMPITVEREIKNGKMSYHEEEKIYISIPPGIDDGEIIEIEDKGHICNDNRGPIKLYIRVASSIYDRKGLNLIYTQTVSFKESICGFAYIMQHIDGSKLNLKSSRGNVIQNGDEKNIKGRGFARDGQVGDLIIRFKVTPPKLLTEPQLLLFESEL